MVAITAYVVVKHNRDEDTADVFGVFNTAQMATDAVIADFEKIRTEIGARSLRGRLDSILVDSESATVTWIDDLGHGVKTGEMPAINFSVTRTALQEA
jgi:hypothetical protein